MSTKSTQVTQDEFELYLNNRLRLATLEKNLAITYGEIKGALDAEQSVSIPAHASTIKSVLGDGWLLTLLRSLRKIFSGGGDHSPRLLKLKSLVVDTIQFIEAAYPNRASYYNVSNADQLIERLRTISNAIGKLRSRAEEKLISSHKK